MHPVCRCFQVIILHIKAERIRMSQVTVTSQMQLPTLTWKQPSHFSTCSLMKKMFITCSELQMRRILNIALRGEVLFPAWSTLWWNHCAINWQEIWMRIKSPSFIRKENKQLTNWEKIPSWDYWIIKWQDFQVTSQLCHPCYLLSKWKYISA